MKSAGAFGVSVAAGVIAGLTTLVALAPASRTSAAGSVTCGTAGTLGGSAGCDNSLPATPSAVTVSGPANSPFAGLRVTVNQTADLVDQAVSVVWTGGSPTTTNDRPILTRPWDGVVVADNYLQLMQCWGDDGTGTGPPPEQCEFGAMAASYQVNSGVPQVSANNSAYPSELTAAVTRTLGSPGLSCGAQPPTGCETYQQLTQLATTDPSKAYVDPSRTAEVVDPFQPVQGDRVNLTNDFTCCVNPPPWSSGWDQNPWFTHSSSNEIDFGRTYAEGTGQVLFRVETGLNAAGLGCGQAQTNPDGSAAPPPKCWLVIVPRGSAATEDPPGTNDGFVQPSPLYPMAWQHRIAIPLQFQPVSTACSSGATTRRVLGGEMAQAAIHSWQPILCAQSGASTYLYTQVGEDAARTQILHPGPGVIASATTFPLDPSTVDPANPLVYAPLTLSGAVITFNIQRFSNADVARYPMTGGYPPDEADLLTRPVTQLNLTPRLVAKLLTESYRGAGGPFRQFRAASSSGWLAKNAYTLLGDPDFIQYNPEFAELAASDLTNGAQVVVEQPSSDAATVMWQWILADPAAKAWLAGAPDPWGMQVNPYYLSDPTMNPAHLAFANPTPDNFPKLDPFCYAPTDAAHLIGNQEARPLCAQDWNPYVNSMSGAAAAVLAANSGAKTQFNGGAPDANSAWAADGPQVEGERLMFGITTGDQAARYGLRVASVSQAGDDGSSPSFVAPDVAGLTGGEAAMTPSAVQGVLVPNPSTRASGAYPLSMLTYAAVAPVGLDSGARTDAAALLTYAAGGGQTSGLKVGNLPPGYAPLPGSLASQTTQAAALVLNPSSLEPTTTTTTTAPTTTVAASVPVPAQTTPRRRSGVRPVAPVRSALAVTPSTVAPHAKPAPTTSPGAAPVTSSPSSASIPQLPASGKTPPAKPGTARFAVIAALLVGLIAAGGTQVLVLRR